MNEILKEGNVVFWKSKEDKEQSGKISESNIVTNKSEKKLLKIELESGIKQFIEIERLYIKKPTLKPKKVEEKKLNEKEYVSFDVVYANAQDSVVVTLNSKNMNKVEDLKKEAYEQLKKIDPDASDDFWINDIFVSSGSLPDVNWQAILTNNGSQLDQNSVNMVFDEPEEFTLKANFLNSYGYDITEDNLDEVMVYNAVNERWVDGNWDVRLPEEWLSERVKEMGWLKEKIFETNYSYFEEGFARVISDDTVNSTTKFDKVGDYFVYSYIN